MEIVTKRIYDEASPDDGYRALVDRLWPRGMSKQRAALDEWDKDVAPSNELRVAFHHDGLPFHDFEVRYRAELDASDAPAALLARAQGASRLTLLGATRDQAHDQAVVLADYLRGLQARA